MGAFRCRLCERTYVQRLLCRDGHRRIFVHQPIPADAVPAGETGWVPVKADVNGRRRTVMAPTDRVGAWGATVARVAVLHRCPVITG